ncbi:MAG TPA: N-acetylmuramoyl-L-alanine amidase [Verrucomicrobiae bacterium]|nr:N-acetylmuramoyl-L-alanine amidase [Verrucomicrobiae bacterium]
MRATDAGKRRFARARPLAAGALATSALGLMLAWGCGPPAPPQQVAPPPTRKGPAAGYDGRRDSLDSVDASVLRGRKIVLDPGHGGFFPGTMGVGGLTEKEVNLGVALDLRDLLTAAGAQVTMTRDTDRDFLTPADSSLRSDLAARVAIANAAQPDLFVSVHHNADPGGLHDVNETQTYYQLGDEGPSYDAAQDVYRALTRNLGIEVTKMIPGNFFVVRNTVAPALLTEVSYLTYPPTEEKLRTPAARKLEAEVLYLGITRWFMRHSPKLASFDALDAAGQADTTFTATPRLVAGVDGAFDAVTLRIDGAAVPTVVTGGRIEWSGTPPLAGGDHDASFSARFAGEGASRVKKLRFHLKKPPARVVLDLQGSPLAAARELFAVRARVLDRDDLAVPDSFALRLTSLPKGTFVPAETTLHAWDGEAWGYLRRSRRVTAKAAERATIVAQLLHVGPSVAPARAALANVRSVTRTGFALRAPADSALTLGAAARPAWLNRDGFLSLPLDSAGAVAIPRLAGFRRAGADTLWPPRFVAVAGAALQGRRIALDPEGGGDDPAGSAPGGTRASALNLEVARALAAMLEASGAAVVMTRSGDNAVSELERVQVSEAFKAERYLRIGHANTNPSAGYYFNSGGGKRWAQRVSTCLASLSLDSVRVAESPKYPLAQVSAVALYVSPARVDSSESRLLASGRLRAEAYALFLALAQELAAPPASWPLDSLRVLDADGAPRPGAAVTLGAALVVATDSSGTARFARSEPGDLPVEVVTNGIRLRALLLESERGRVLQVPR